MYSLETIRRLNSSEFCKHGEWPIECPECNKPPSRYKQCPALSLFHLMSNCCILEEGHSGKHENNLGTVFTKFVMKSTDLPDGWGNKCQDHPRYQLKRKPTGNCEMCWRLWIKKNS